MKIDPPLLLRKSKINSVLINPSH